MRDHLVARSPNRDQAVALGVVDVQHQPGRGLEVRAPREEPEHARAGVQAPQEGEHRRLVLGRHRADVNRRAVAQRHIRFPVCGVDARFGHQARLTPRLPPTVRAL
jgi:hypothetical protein